MSIRNLIESAIKGDALSFNEAFTNVMGEAAVAAVEEVQNPTTIEDVIETLLNLEVLTVEELESEDFTEETLLELSKKTLGNYIKSASIDKSYHAHDMGVINGVAQTTGTNATDRKERDVASRKHGKRSGGIQRAVNKLTKEETEVTEEVIELDEISKKVLGSYIKKASEDKTSARHRWTNMMNAKGYTPADRAIPARQEKKRTKGIAKAVDKLTKEETETQIDELSSATLGSYVRKSSKQAVRAATMTNQGKNKDMEKIMNKRLDGVERAAGQIQNKKD